MNIEKMINYVAASTQRQNSSLSRMIVFLANFRSILADIYAKSPYVINILDEVRANENAHSRIMSKLLMFTENKQHLLLESFLNTLGDPFASLISQLQEHEPMITTGTGFVDVRIRIGNHSIIIENKIHGAVDQFAQIESYVAAESNYLLSTYGNENTWKIFVLYLTNAGGEPADHSLSDRLRIKLGDAYRAITYKNEIRQWLRKIKNEFGQSAGNRQTLLMSAVLQYLDYLDGRFYSRDREVYMSKQIMKQLDEAFNFNTIGTNAEKIEKLQEAESLTLEIGSALKVYQENIWRDQLSAAEKALRTIKLPSLDADPLLKGDFGQKHSGIYFHPKKWKGRYYVGFTFDQDCTGFTYAIYDKSHKAPESLQNSLRKKLGGEQDVYWPFWIIFSGTETQIGTMAFFESTDFLQVCSAKIEEILSTCSNIDELQA